MLSPYQPRAVLVSNQQITPGSTYRPKVSDMRDISDTAFWEAFDVVWLRSIENLSGTELGIEDPQIEKKFKALLILHAYHFFQAKHEFEIKHFKTITNAVNRKIAVYNQNRNKESFKRVFAEIHEGGNVWIKLISGRYVAAPSLDEGKEASIFKIQQDIFNALLQEVFCEFDPQAMLSRIHLLREWDIQAEVPVGLFTVGEVQKLKEIRDAYIAMHQAIYNEFQNTANQIRRIIPGFSVDVFKRSYQIAFSLLKPKENQVFVDNFLFELLLQHKRKPNFEKELVPLFWNFSTLGSVPLEGYIRTTEHFIPQSLHQILESAYAEVNTPLIQPTISGQALLEDGNRSLVPLANSSIQSAVQGSARIPLFAQRNQGALQPQKGLFNLHAGKTISYTHIMNRYGLVFGSGDNRDAKPAVVLREQAQEGPDAGTFSREFFRSISEGAQDLRFDWAYQYTFSVRRVPITNARYVPVNAVMGYQASHAWEQEDTFGDEQSGNFRAHGYHSALNFHACAFEAQKLVDEIKNYSTHPESCTLEMAFRSSNNSEIQVISFETPKVFEKFVQAMRLTLGEAQRNEGRRELEWKESEPRALALNSPEQKMLAIEALEENDHIRDTLVKKIDQECKNLLKRHKLRNKNLLDENAKRRCTELRRLKKTIKEISDDIQQRRQLGLHGENPDYLNDQYKSNLTAAIQRYLDQGRLDKYPANWQKFGILLLNIVAGIFAPIKRLATHSWLYSFYGKSKETVEEMKEMVEHRLDFRASPG